jgi:hypothetical protein
MSLSSFSLLHCTLHISFSFQINRKEHTPCFLINIIFCSLLLILLLFIIIVSYLASTVAIIECHYYAFFLSLLLPLSLHIISQDNVDIRYFLSITVDIIVSNNYYFFHYWLSLLLSLLSLPLLLGHISLRSHYLFQ